MCISHKDSYRRDKQNIMNVLILSCNTGAGHNTAATALKNHFLSLNIPCEMADSLAHISKPASHIISDGHVFIYRKLPTTFGKAYEYEETHSMKPVYKLMSLGAESLYRKIREEGYDTIICTHVFAAMMVTEIKKRHKSNFKHYFISTDYTCHPGMEEVDADVYFTPHPLIDEEFARKGDSPEKLIPYGIPIRDEFYTPIGKQEARRKLELPENARILLLSCGSMGAGPMMKLATDLASNIGKNAYLVAICGTNQHLYNKMSEALAERSNVRVIGFTQRIKLYMEASDLFLTKPGGLSSTEAFYLRLPMIAINAVPGCETRNIEFFEKHGLAETAKSADDIVHLALRRLRDEKYLGKISERIADFFKGNPTADICEEIIKGAKDFASEN